MSFLVGSACGPKAACDDCTGVGELTGTAGLDSETAANDSDAPGDPTGDDAETAGSATSATATDATATDATVTSAPLDTTSTGDPPGGTDPTDTGWETGGLGCAGQPITHLVDARLIAAADLPELPAWAEPDGHVLILSSTPAICDAPLQGPACGVGHEYRVFVALPPGFEPGIYYFGVFFDGPQDDPDLKSWSVLSHTAECPGGGQLPEGNYSKGVLLEVDSFDPAASAIAGRLCGAYQPGLGDLAGDFAAQGCG